MAAYTRNIRTADEALCNPIADDVHPHAHVMVRMSFNAIGFTVEAPQHRIRLLRFEGYAARHRFILSEKNKQYCV